ncbi:LysM peptidoglycan-binding domain-containing protein [Ligilactobacillus aviarius]|uniref:C40 family peptidase n=1 Tax=Ligilactobacillus aviarius TaxID=1606 RepID=UPI0025A36739|nr:LysM peptidoglycan-binding domain-containing protein [Ligilactobacillus aviarius]MDM8278666.1 LysM peptidoglycan-binding domain-containing protein [Ligilactobacillus aviarius]
MKKTAKKIVAGTVGAAGLFLASAATAVNADSVHRVVKNDTVWALSQKFGVSIKSIEQLNHIDQNTNMIYVGQDLQIPNKDAQAPKNNTHTYTVQSGDSLWAIAQKFNTSVDHLKQLNGLTSNLIYVGQTLKVDGQASAQPAKAATPAPAKTAAQPVQQQAPVAKASVASSTQKAAPAQQPSVQSTVKSTPAIQSTVKQTPVASSVSSAAPASSATQAQPATSSVATSKVAPAVSSSQAPVSSSASSASVSSSSASQQTVASSSSSQTSVASSVSSAAPASSVSSQSSSKQPVIAANHTTATVKSGDSLYAIAQEYGVSVASLREANPNLGNSLTVGQSLIVNNPTKNPAAASSSSQQAQASSASSQQQAPQARTANNQQAAQSNNNNQAAQASSQAQQSSTTRTGSGNNVVSYAESFIGVPYVYGGTTPSGFDCSGFVQYVYNHFGKSLPRTTTQQENCGTQIPVSQAQPGDLYFWGNKGSAYHVAICVGNGKYIAAPEPGQSVSIGSTQYFQPSFAVRL